MIKEKLQEIKAILPIWCLMHYTKTDWGEILYFMVDDASGYAKLFVYTDTDYHVYLSELSVNDNVRKTGIGTKLQVLREKIGKLIGAKYSFLWCEKDSWMHEWYKSRDYKDFQKHEDPKMIWMIKNLD